MADAFVVHDLFLPHRKRVLKSAVKPLTCVMCNSELNGKSITAKKVNGRTVFLCSRHLDSDTDLVVMEGLA